MSLTKPVAPYYEITQYGRWTWYITVHDGVMCQWGPDGGGWFALGHGRAIRKAKRKLAKYHREVTRRAASERGR